MKNKIKTNSGEMEFGMMVVIFLVALFAIWVLMGGPKNNDSAEKPFIKPATDQEAPLETYGQVKLPN